MDEKSLSNLDAADTKKNASDAVFFGDRDMFVLMTKASSERQGWMKSTKACELPGGCLVQVSTQQRNPDGSYAVAEALTYVPGVSITTVVGEDGTVSRMFDGM